jgi:multidrug efflux pump subunit AcrB
MIIIAENMHRHFKMKRLPFKQAAIYAINEVGNPTILATFTVIAAYRWRLYRNDGPLYESDAHWCFIMILSLFVALTVTPFRYHLLQEKRRSKA